MKETKWVMVKWQTGKMIHAKHVISVNKFAKTHTHTNALTSMASKFNFIAAYLLFTSSNNSLVPSTVWYAANIYLDLTYIQFHTRARRTHSFFFWTKSIYQNGMEWSLQEKERKLYYLANCFFFGLTLKINVCTHLKMHS